MAIDIESDAESGLATDVDPPSPLPPLPASPSGSVVYEPLSPSVEAVFVPPPGFSGPGYAGFSCAPPGCPPAPLLAPPNFWASDFDHMSLTGLIGLPAPGYALSAPITRHQPQRNNAGTVADQRASGHGYKDI